MNENTRNFIENDCRILIVGAGGLGCEMLRLCSMLGISNIHIIDFDTVELTNLNRQLLFEKCDIEKPKAVIASTKINEKMKRNIVKGYYCDMKRMPDSFYNSFNVVLCGLDSVEARLWINRKIFSLIQYDQDFNFITESVIPIIDGGTEGLKGHVHVIIPTITDCINCIADTFTPEETYQICTITNNIRTPVHCIQYSLHVLWDRKSPFKGEDFDANNEEHCLWVHERAVEISSQKKIASFDYKFTLGVVKNIIPATTSTLAIVANKCVLEMYKLLLGFPLEKNNYYYYNGSEGASTSSIQLNKNEKCDVCGIERSEITLNITCTIMDLVKKLEAIEEFERERSCISCTIRGNPQVLYINVENVKNDGNELTKTLKDLMIDNDIIYVSDQNKTSPKQIKLNFTD